MVSQKVPRTGIQRGRKEVRRGDCVEKTRGQLGAETEAQRRAQGQPRRTGGSTGKGKVPRPKKRGRLRVPERKARSSSKWNSMGARGDKWCAGRRPSGLNGGLPGGRNGIIEGYRPHVQSKQPRPVQTCRGKRVDKNAGGCTGEGSSVERRSRSVRPPEGRDESLLKGFWKHRRAGKKAAGDLNVEHVMGRTGKRRGPRCTYHGPDLRAKGRVR